MQTIEIIAFLKIKSRCIDNTGLCTGHYTGQNRI